MILRKKGFNFVNATAVSAAFLMVFSTICMSSSSFFFNKAWAVSPTDVVFGGAGFNLLNNEALQRWYGQCLASLGTSTGSTALSSSIPSTTGPASPFIVGSGNNRLTPTTSADNCTQQLQLYLSQLLSSFQQCIISATTGNSFVRGGVGFSIAMRECALLALQQQQQQGSLEAQSGNNIPNNGFTSTITNPLSPSITSTAPISSPFTQYPTTSNSNFGAFQRLNPGFSSNSIGNNPLTVTTLPSTISNNPFTQYPTTSNSNFGAFQNLNPTSNNNGNNNLITASNRITPVPQP
jgi:hypothetical protein